jgi:type III restriction enzyme
LDADGHPTNQVIPERRKSTYITPFPKSKKIKKGKGQAELDLGIAAAADDKQRQYDPTPIINELRTYVEQWRALPEAQWQVTPETARLLRHWRHHSFHSVRPFFCQIEAAEIAIWLAEVAPKRGEIGKKLLNYLKAANEDANPELFRIALKLATGAGKTTVMAMLIAWQAINAARYPSSKLFSRGFLIVTPGITIRDRLRVLLPSDPENYYLQRELVPADLLADIRRAKVVITNYHAFKLREELPLASGTKALLKGRGPELKTLESEGRMLQRVVGELMGMKNIVVINDEAHHCYRERPRDSDDDLVDDEKDEADNNNEAARLWISGIEMLKRKIGVRTVYDLSATPFFLRGSGYAEGSLFPWTVSDFSLMDAIECGIVKLPRIPVADNIPNPQDLPKYRNLWEHIGKRLPRKNRSKSGSLDPLSLPAELCTALDALYGHYEKTFDLWQKEGIAVPPVFIVVCSNTAVSKLVYDYISGFHQTDAKTGETQFNQGRLKLFRNYDDAGHQLPRPRTLLIDSVQLESGEALSTDFREIAAEEIEHFRRELIERTGDSEAGRKFTDQDILREVMNTVGKPGKLGESIRCVVSVSMLTEGWDANTVTHILGVRAFGTQLLCEQVVGRALRRQSYDLNEENLFDVEYADILGIPFDFTSQPVLAPPKKPKETVRVASEAKAGATGDLQFPRVIGYKVDLPTEHLRAAFTPDSVLELTPDFVGATIVHNQGIIGEGVKLTVEHLATTRQNEILYHLVKHLLFTKFRDADEVPKLHLFGELKAITRQWLETCLVCKGKTYPAQVLYSEIADLVCEKIHAAITAAMAGEKPVLAILDPYNPIGSTAHVSFNTSKALRWKTDPRKCPVNWIVCDSAWEQDFCRVLEGHERVRAYVKNQGLAWKSPTASGPPSTNTCPTSSSASMTATGRTTSSTSWSRSKGSAARTPRPRPRPCGPIGSPVSTTSRNSAVGSLRNSKAPSTSMRILKNS